MTQCPLGSVPTLGKKVGYYLHGPLARTAHCFVRLHSEGLSSHLTAWQLTSDLRSSPPKFSRDAESVTRTQHPGLGPRWPLPPLPVSGSSLDQYVAATTGPGTGGPPPAVLRAHPGGRLQGAGSGGRHRGRPCYGQTLLECHELFFYLLVLSLLTYLRDALQWNGLFSKWNL